MIKPFKVYIDQDKLDDLKARLERTRWPDEITNSNWTYGASLDYMKELHNHWLSDYDWRATENEINKYENFIASIDDYNIHFLHVKGIGKKSIPIIITHGWPGSFLEMMKLIPLLTQHAELSFDVIAPSMLGYGFSGKVIEPGCNVGLMADLWAKLMHSLGYKKYVVQGGDFGAGVSSSLALKYPDRVIGMHLNYIPGNYVPELMDKEEFTKEEKEYIKSENEWYFVEGGYKLQQKTKPLTLSYGLNDSPMGLCAWIVEKMFGWADSQGAIEKVFTKDELLSNVTLYWLTETIHSSIRLYVEDSKYALKLGKSSFINSPVGIARFRYEEPFPPRKFIERGFNIQHWSDFPEGGHFPAMEKPEILATDIFTFFKNLSK